MDTNPTPAAPSLLVAAAQNLVAVFSGLPVQVIETIPGAINDAIAQVARALAPQAPLVADPAPVAASIAEAPAPVAAIAPAPVADPAPAPAEAAKPTADIRIGRSCCEIRLNGETNPSEILVNREAGSSADAGLFGRVVDLQATHTVTLSDL